MLDENRKAMLQRLDVKRIKPNGVIWIFGQEIRTYQLSKEDIRYLRWYHNDPEIAYEVDTRVQRQTYRVAEDRNRYNRNYRTKGKVNNNGLRNVVIIGSLVVSIVLGGTLLSHQAVARDDITKETVNVESQIALANNEETQYDFGTVAKEDLTTVADVSTETHRIETIKHLCDIYQVNYQTVYSKLKEITNNFTNEGYLNGHLDIVTCKGYDVYADSEDELLTYTIRAMKQDPGRFNLDESIYIHNGYDSGDDYYAQISDVCEVLGVDRDLMYAIVNAETSFNSELFRTINNPAGLRGINGVDPWWVFENKEEGFIEFGMELVKYYKMVGADRHDVSPDTVAQIGNIHAPLSDGNENWLPNVLSGLEYAQNNENELFGGEEVHGLGR